MLDPQKHLNVKNCCDGTENYKPRSHSMSAICGKVRHGYR
jgi:hypothetical protein